jgi:nitroimidazol reductase NimA-like FMN-containing flavoprotein (pyridoxamine 5'-phosphate oxidase superfamily)
MSEQEVRAYIQTNSRLILITNGIRGYPHAMPMNYVYTEDHRIVMTTFRKSQKVKNLQRDPRATLLIESGEDYRKLKSVLFYADAEISSDSTQIGEITELMLEKWIGANQKELKKMKEQALSAAPKKVLLSFTLGSPISWDHGKLNDRY